MAVETIYRFSEFQLHPAERVLTRNEVPVPLTPKAFDALLCLISKAGRLVSKDELMHRLWPSTFVAEANLTNAIVSLRKAIGHGAIRTVSKYGYRFDLSVEGEPGIALEVYQAFSRAKELTTDRSLEALVRAQELYWLCIAKDPGFAPAWAWLGRTCALLAKFSESRKADRSLADAAFKRAFAIEPDLACAHYFYTPIQADMGHAREALDRLRGYLTRHPGEPEILAALVQVLRFCGLLDESIEAHKRAKELDPAIVTSVAHTQFLQANYEAALESYGGRVALYLDAAAWAALDRKERAREVLCRRLETGVLSKMMGSAIASLLAIVEGRSEDAIGLIPEANCVPDPEMQFYLARHCAYLGDAGRSILWIKSAAQAGFVCPPGTLRCDPWLQSVRAHSDYASLLHLAEELTEDARRTWQAKPLPAAYDPRDPGHQPTSSQPARRRFRFDGQPQT